jgi:methionine sulfoxide reductase heme-binding subunit
MTTGAERRVPYPWLKPGVLVGSLVPIAAIVDRAAHGELGADPIAQALNQLGLVALVFLIAALACTPLKLSFGWTWPIRLRRMLGVLAFVYAALHVATYVALDQSFDWTAIFADVVKRKFIFVGFAAFVLIVPLAATSTNTSVKRLGFVRWKRLHRLAYLAPAFAVLHFVWRVKKDITEPAVYGTFLAALLLIRVCDFWWTRHGSPHQTAR